MARDTADELVDVLRSLVRAGRTSDRTTLAGVGGTTARLLSHVAALEPRASVSTVAAASGVGKPTTSRQIAAAEHAGLVVRSADATDRRAITLTLTAAGRTAVEEHRTAGASRIRSATADWSLEDRDALLQLLERLLRADAMQPQVAQFR